MQQAMLIVMFILGVALVIVAIIGFFGKKDKEGGTIKFPGFEISGKGGAALFLLVGVFLLFSGMGWYGSVDEVSNLEQTVTNIETEKNEITSAAANLYSELDQQRAINKSLLARIPQQELNQLKKEEPELLNPKHIEVSPKIEQILRNRLGR